MVDNKNPVKILVPAVIRYTIGDFKVTGKVETNGVQQDFSVPWSLQYYGTFKNTSGTVGRGYTQSTPRTVVLAESFVKYSFDKDLYQHRVDCDDRRIHYGFSYYDINDLPRDAVYAPPVVNPKQYMEAMFNLDEEMIKNKILDNFKHATNRNGTPLAETMKATLDSSNVRYDFAFLPYYVFEESFLFMRSYGLVNAYNGSAMPSKFKDAISDSASIVLATIIFDLLLSKYVPYEALVIPDMTVLAGYWIYKFRQRVFDLKKDPKQFLSLEKLKPVWQLYHKLFIESSSKVRPSKQDEKKGNENENESSKKAKKGRAEATKREQSKKSQKEKAGKKKDDQKATNKTQDPKSYYKLLGIINLNDITDDVIRRSYIEKAKVYHPDVCGDDLDVKDHWLLIQEAYEALQTEEKRQKYSSI
jgi:hypothetical protein